MAKTDPMVLVQMRLPPEEADELREAARKAGRTLPGEMRHRLDTYHEDSISRAMGDLVALLTADVEATFAASPNPQPEMLGTIRDALVRVLNGLGATDPSDAAEEFAVSKYVAFRALRWLLSPVALPDEPPAIRRIRGALIPRQQPKDGE